MTCTRSLNTRRTRRLVFAAVTILLGAFAPYTRVLVVFRDHLQAYLGIGFKAYGLLQSSGFIPGAIGALAAGVLVHRTAPRLVVRLSLLGVGLGLALGAWPGPSALRVAGTLVVVTAFAQALAVSVQAYAVDLFPHNRRRVLSATLVAAGGAGIVYALWAELLLAWQGSDPAVSFGAILHWPFAVMAVVMAASSFLYRPAKGLGTRRVPQADEHGSAGGRKDVWPLVGLLALHGTVDMAAFVWMPRVLASPSFATPTVLPGVVMGGFSLAYVTSRGLLAVLPERAGRRALLILPGLCGGGIFLSGMLSRDYTLTAAGYVVGAFCWSAEWPSFAAELSRRAGNRFALCLSIAITTSSLGAFALSYVMGALGDSLPDDQLWRILLLPAMGFPLVGLGGAIWLALSRRSANR